MGDAARLLLDDTGGESLLRRILEKLPAVFWAVDSQMRVTASAGSEMVLFARESGGIVGKTLHELISDTGKQAPLIAAHERALHGEMTSCEITWHERTYQVRTYPLSGPDETIVGCTALLQDVTEWRGTEESIRKAYEELEWRVQERLASIGTLTAGLAHELNNPLGAIILSAAAALRAMDQPEGRDILRRSLENVQSGAARCSQIVKSVSQFAHEEVSKKWSYDLVTVVRRAIHGTSQLAKSRNVMVCYDSEKELPNVDINPTGMEQVFINVISNAIHASESGKQVRIWGECGTKRIRVHVEDEGCGMSDVQRCQACEPFFTTRQQQGCAGLGLSIACGIVEQHGGMLRIKSSLGEGTTVTVVLPSMVHDETDRENDDAQTGGD